VSGSPPPAGQPVAPSAGAGASAAAAGAPAAAVDEQANARLAAAAAKFGSHPQQLLDILAWFRQLR